MTTDDDCDRHRTQLLKMSEAQVKARVATDVLRLVEPDDGAEERHLYALARDYLVGYFGGVTDHDSSGGYG